MTPRSSTREDDDPSAGEAEQRRELVHQVISEAEEALRACGEPGLSRSVVQAMLRVPRARFVPAHKENLAYTNTALGIGHGQTISQPLVVALMTHLLHVGPEDTVLEIGTGSGYQAAVLSELVRHVFSVEIVPELGSAARRRLAALGYDNVSVHLGDGGCGWSEHAPYDAIVVTAATPEVPAGLLDELKPGGRLVIPLGEVLAVQWLTVVHKGVDGHDVCQRIMPVRFVPLVGNAAVP